jgi:hypothetical protein
MPVTIDSPKPLAFGEPIDLLALDRFGKDLRTEAQVIDKTGDTRYVGSYDGEPVLIQFRPVWFGMTVWGVSSMGGSVQYDRPGENCSSFGRWVWPVVIPEGAI